MATMCYKKPEYRDRLWEGLFPPTEVAGQPRVVRVIEGDGGTPSVSKGPDRLTESQKAFEAVCELLKSPVLTKGTLFYLAQLKEVLGIEISALRTEVKKPIPFPKIG